MTTIRVVLAEDHLVVRASIRKLLEGVPDIKIVGEANNGIEAFRLAQELAPEVLVLDIEMPYMTGVEVARQLQAVKSPVRILALSAYDDWSYIKALLETGAAGYLTKVEAPEILVEAVRGVAQGEQGWISRQAAKKVMAWSRQQEKEESTRIPLTEREEAMLRLMVAGKINREIGQTLDMSEQQVEICLETIFAKLGVTSRIAAAKLAVQEGLV